MTIRQVRHHAGPPRVHDVIDMRVTIVAVHQDGTMATYELADEEGRTLVLFDAPTGYGTLVHRLPSERTVAVGDRVRITNGDYRGRLATVEDRYEDPISGEVIEVYVDATMIGQAFHEAFSLELYPSEVERAALPSLTKQQLQEDR